MISGWTSAQLRGLSFKISIHSYAMPSGILTKEVHPEQRLENDVTKTKSIKITVF